MWKWWPQGLPHDFIAPLRSIGRNLSLGGGKIEKHGPSGEDQYKFSFKAAMTDAESEVLQLLYPLPTVLLSKTLANGVKLFRLPATLQEQLEETAVPLTVDLLSLPFEAQIVETPTGENHFVYRCPESKQVIIATIPHDLRNGTVDAVCMMSQERDVESYLTGGTFNWTTGEHVPPGLFQHHKFRATINYLLLATLEGVSSQGKLPVAYPKRKSQAALVATQPELMAIQNIRLFKSHTMRALESMPTDRTMRPHYRRAHWRHVAFGKGRAERKLVLIPWVLVNKKRLAEGQDPAESEYNATPTQRNAVT